MGISWVEWGQTGLGKRLASLGDGILLTSLRHVNRPATEFMPQRIQNSVLGAFASTFLLPD
jgi:hypothetical protein